MSGRRVIDYSRYRVAEAIAEQWRAGDTAESLGETYFGMDVFNGMEQNGSASKYEAWIVELIVAAYDRKERFAPQQPMSEESGE